MDKEKREKNFTVRLSQKEYEYLFDLNNKITNNT